MNRSVQVELVGRKIRQMRRQHKLTQTELADRIGIHQSDLSRMEQGEYRVGLDTLLKVLQTFDVGIGEFFEERPQAVSPMEDYLHLSPAAQKEVEDFIAFKRMQEETLRDGESEGDDDVD
ncbi:MAG: helix-turn-helix domain-containing protein [Thermoanaerobaculia bacterium]